MANRKTVATVKKGDWRAEYERRKGVFGDETFIKLMRDQSFVPYYLYMQPTSGESWGELLAIRDGDPVPDHAELVTAERLPLGTRQQLRAFIERFVGRLPLIPAVGPWSI